MNRVASHSTKSCTSKGGYKSIGSFHSEDPAALLRQMPELYTIPDLPFDGQQKLFEGSNFSSKFDVEASTTARRDDFAIDFENWTFINHGAFGAALHVGANRAEAWRRYMETQPLRYFDRDLLPHLVFSARRLRQFLQLDSTMNRIALIPNATAGLNAVLASHCREYRNGAHCVVWDTTYGSVKTMARYYFGGDRVSTIPFQAEKLPSYDQTVSELARSALDDFLDSPAAPQQNQPGTCFVLDHTTSNTALTLPVADLAKRIKEHYCDPHPALVVVDGAHGLWAEEPLDNTILYETDQQEGSKAPAVDVYVTNGHKWLAAPRGIAALLVFNAELAKRLVPAVISHGGAQDTTEDLFTRFVWDGCRDYGAALALPAVLDYWSDDPTIPREMCRSTLRSGVELLSQEWHGLGDSRHGQVTLTPDSPRSSVMCLVRIPCSVQPQPTATSADAKRLQDYLYSQMIEVPIKCINGELYVRISAHVYNDPRDYEILVHAVLELVRKS